MADVELEPINAQMGGNEDRIKTMSTGWLGKFRPKNGVPGLRLSTELQGVSVCLSRWDVERTSWLAGLPAKDILEDPGCPTLRRPCTTPQCPRART